MFMPWWNISHFEDILRERKKKKNSLSSPVSMTKLISNFRTISSTDSHNNGSIKDKKKSLWTLSNLSPEDLLLCGTPTAILFIWWGLLISDKLFPVAHLNKGSSCALYALNILL